MGENYLVLSADPFAWSVAAALVGAWLLLTAYMLRKRPQADVGAARILVVHASQTGHAADLAEQLRLRVEARGESCAAVEADRLAPPLLAQANRLFFIASTTGEGEAPDNARRFERMMAAERADLSGKSVALLALGDRRYAQFCAFGRRIDRWARGGGAEMLFPAVEVDDLAPADLAAWETQLDRLGYPARAATTLDIETRWRISDRRQVAGASHDPAGGLNSDGLYSIALRPQSGEMPAWEIGDLFELRTPDGHVRDYSIANRPGGEEIRLFVRRVVDGGVVGRGSGHLTDAEIGSSVITGRVRTHRSFHPPTGDGPLLAIGAGSGWAGLRPHLLHAMALGQRCRLIFGERIEEEASPLLAGMRRWLTGEGMEGRLDRLDFALSCAGGPAGRYVQHVVEEQARDIATFLGDTGRILLCGRLAMGEESLDALAAALGPDWLDRAREEGRLRRDLY
ncbi:MAG: flavodoxin domain-containing protein [Sphingobium sp.]